MDSDSRISCGNHGRDKGGWGFFFGGLFFVFGGFGQKENS